MTVFLKYLQSMYKIGFCGAHGTGKTTLVEILAPELNLLSISGTIRSTWQNFGVTDFEKMPSDARSVFQNYMLLKQIEREDIEGKDGFVADRTVIDILGYTVLSASMSESQLKIFEQLVKERLKSYTHFVYTPIEFEAENEHLRANVSTRAQVDKIMKSYIDKWLVPENYLIATGTVEERVQKVKNFLNK